MKLLRDLNNLPGDVCQGAVTIGNFDGVHQGHAEIIRRLLAKADEVDGPAIVFTFEPHPARLLRPDQSPPPLTWAARKALLLAELGVDAVIAYPTDEALLALSAREFFDGVIRERLAAKALVEGTNFFFGHDRQGDVDILDQFCAESDVSLDVVQPIEIDGKIVSSSRIRAAVGAGRVDEALRLLTRPYRIRGTVVHGAGRGVKLGFPTANLEAIDTLLPSEGIYAGRAMVEGDAWPAAISLGPNPTFDEGHPKVEVHLIDYSGSLYERSIEVEFLARLRGVVRFNSVDELIAEMDRDIATTRQVAADYMF